MSRPVGIVAGSLVFASLYNVAQVSAQEEKAPYPAVQTQDQWPERLLIDAYVTGMNSSPPDRAFLLTTLSSAASTIQPSLCRLWSEELFKLSLKLPMDWNRIASQKNAVVALSAVDPDRAFELFGQIDTPTSQRPGDLPEDLRADAANTVFDRYWNLKGPAALEQLRSQANHVGDTGQYPYVAMAPILVQLTKTKSDSSLLATTLFGDALMYYARGSIFPTEDHDFVAFLEEAWDVLPENLRQQGLELAVKKLTQNLKPAEGEIFSAKIDAKGGIARLQSESEQELYELLPRIREINARWAHDLVSENAFLAQAGTGPRKASYEGSAVVRYDPSATQPDQLSVFRGWAAQTAEFNAAMRAASSSPDDALRMAASLDAGFRLQVYAKVAASLGTNQADQAANLMQQAEAGLDSITDGPTRFRLIVGLAAAAEALHNTKTFNEMFVRGFRLGEELFEQDTQTHPGKLAFQTVSFDGLSKLTELGIKRDQAGTVSRIETIESDSLRADLLVVTAISMKNRQHT